MERFATKCDGLQPFELFQERTRYDEKNKDGLLRELAGPLDPIGHTCFTAGAAAPGKIPGKIRTENSYSAPRRFKAYRQR